MKQIASTEFQKSYSRLTEPHEVTALGRPIGAWYPQGSTLRPVEPEPGFNSRPFNPAPKPGIKKK